MTHGSCHVLSVFLSFSLAHLLFFFSHGFSMSPPKTHGKTEGFGYLLNSGCYFTLKPSKNVGMLGSKNGIHTWMVDLSIAWVFSS